jgi:hypothetical protein
MINPTVLIIQSLFEITYITIVISYALLSDVSGFGGSNSNMDMDYMIY